MAPGKMSVVKGAQPRTVMYLPAATGVVFDILMIRSEKITIIRNFEAREGFLRIKVVTLSTWDTAREEGVSTVRLTQNIEYKHINITYKDIKMVDVSLFE